MRGDTFECLNWACENEKGIDPQSQRVPRARCSRSGAHQCITTRRSRRREAHALAAPALAEATASAHLSESSVQGDARPVLPSAKALSGGVTSVGKRPHRPAMTSRVAMSLVSIRRNSGVSFEEVRDLPQLGAFHRRAGTCLARSVCGQ